MRREEQTTRAIQKKGHLQQSVNAGRVKQGVMNLIQEDDLFHIMYLRPFECKLDTRKEELAKGLKFIHRTSETKFEEIQMTEVLSYSEFKDQKKIYSQMPPIKEEQKYLKDQNSKQMNEGEKLRQQEIKDQKKKKKQMFEKYNTYIQYIKGQHMDNMLCQMKALGELQMAICICMYNEDQAMLQNTLLGVADNILNLQKQGVDPDKIVVIIVSDGIEKVNPEILPLFEIFQKQSGMDFDEIQDERLAQTIHKMQNLSNMKQRGEGQESDEKQKIFEMNNFIFDKDQLEQRKKVRFVEVKKKYDQVKLLMTKIKKLQDQKSITYEDLPPQVTEKFKQQCLLSIEKDSKKENTNGQNDEQEQDKDKNQKNAKKSINSRRRKINKNVAIYNRQQQIEKAYNQIIKDHAKCKPLIQNALTKKYSECREYISSRQDLCHVSFFRTAQFFDEVKLQQIQESNKMEQNTSNNPRISKDKTQQDLLIKKFPNRIKMNLFFCVKYKNNQKLSSHNWFFNGFCKELADFQLEQKGQGKDKIKVMKKGVKNSPKYTILLDVGLRPGQEALCKMYNAMRNDANIGGVCGYMGLKLQKAEESQITSKQNLDSLTSLTLYFVDIQRAQQLQYHFAHLIDKAFQSLFKFIHVLPGAFSGYNMGAIWGAIPPNSKKSSNDTNQHKEDSDKLLSQYFKSINQRVSENDKEPVPIDLTFLNILGRILLPSRLMKCISKIQQNSHQQILYDSNVYLAEDRTLCYGIHKNQYELLFLPDAYSFVDPAKNLAQLMGQRKRWINGSYFAFEDVSGKFSQNETLCGGGFFLSIQMQYLGFMNFLAYLAPGFFLFTISVAMQAFKADVLVSFFQSSLKQDSEVYHAFVYTINFLYTLLILGLVYYSINLTNRSFKFIRFVYTMSTFLGLMSLIIMCILIVDLARGLGQSSSYLIANQDPAFIQSIPGGSDTVDLLRYIVLGIMALYGIPIFFYSILFCSFRVVPEIMGGILSFIFYTPTYLIILSTYALCRMDDLSWGTKGLDSGAENKNAKIEKSWKIVRTLHVGKFLFWNIVVGGLLIHFGSNFLIRFYLTFAIMLLIGSTMLMKVAFAVVYYFIYRSGCWVDPFPKKTVEQSETTERHVTKRSLFDNINENIKIEIENQILKNILRIKDKQRALNWLVRKIKQGFADVERKNNNSERSDNFSNPYNIDSNKKLPQIPNANTNFVINNNVDVTPNKTQLKRFDSGQIAYQPQKDQAQNINRVQSTSQLNKQDQAKNQILNIPDMQQNQEFSPHKSSRGLLKDDKKKNKKGKGLW